MPPVDNEQDNLYVRIQKGHTAQAVLYLSATFREFDKTNSIEINFPGSKFCTPMQGRTKTGQLFLVFTILAVCIACLGFIPGLAAFMADASDLKEIGIRKVLSDQYTVLYRCCPAIF